MLNVIPLQLWATLCFHFLHSFVSFLTECQFHPHPKNKKRFLRKITILQQKYKLLGSLSLPLSLHFWGNITVSSSVFFSFSFTEFGNRWQSLILSFILPSFSLFSLMITKVMSKKQRGLYWWFPLSSKA